MTDKIPSVLAGLTGSHRDRRTSRKAASDHHRETEDFWRDREWSWQDDTPTDDLGDTGSLWQDWNAYKPAKPYEAPKPLHVNHWIKCPAKSDDKFTAHHWGAFGAAGLCIVTRRKRATFVLLALRAKGVQTSGTWSGTIGGAIEGTVEGGATETAWDAALREAGEELTGCPDVWHLGSVEYTCECGWTYTTFVVSVQSGRELPNITPGHWETGATAWVRVSDLDVWPALHPRFADALPDLIKVSERIGH